MDVHDQNANDSFLDVEPVDPENDWREEFPDRATWDLWVAVGWGGAPWTAGALFRAGYSPTGAHTASLNPEHW